MIANTLIPIIASRLPTKLAEPLLLLVPVDVDPAPAVAGEVGAKVAEGLEMHELAAAVAEREDGADGLMSAFPEKSHAVAFFP